jgi:hypothetical protein
MNHSRPEDLNPQDKVLSDETLALLMTAVELCRAEELPPLAYAEICYLRWMERIQDYRQS